MFFLLRGGLFCLGVLLSVCNLVFLIFNKKIKSLILLYTFLIGGVYMDAAYT